MIMKPTRAMTLWLGVLLATFSTCALAFNIVDLSYDSDADEIVFKVAYRGTHENHVFTVRWEQCRRRGDGQLEVFGLVEDSEPNDPARADFQKILNIGMSQLPCRPAYVTIGGANPRHRKTITIPPQKSR
jgi:hypothetical protein